MFFMFQEAILNAERNVESMMEEKIASDMRDEINGTCAVATGFKTPTTPRRIPEPPTPTARSRYNTSVTPTTTNTSSHGKVYKLYLPLISRTSDSNTNGSGRHIPLNGRQN